MQRVIDLGVDGIISDDVDRLHPRGKAERARVAGTPAQR